MKFSIKLCSKEFMRVVFGYLIIASMVIIPFSVAITLITMILNGYLSVKGVLIFCVVAYVLYRIYDKMDKSKCYEYVDVDDDKPDSDYKQ